MTARLDSPRPISEFRRVCGSPDVPKKNEIAIAPMMTK